MKTQIATDREQSRRLLACGVKPETADMCYIGVLKPVHAIPFSKCDNKKDTPAWSLSCLLALLPTEITKAHTSYYLDFAPCENKGWSIGYFSNEPIRSIKGLTHPTDPIEVCVRAIEWLIANGYSLNNIEQ